MRWLLQCTKVLAIALLHCDVTALIPVIAGFETPAFPTSNFLFLTLVFRKSGPKLPHVDWDNVIFRHGMGYGCYVGFMAAHPP